MVTLNSCSTCTVCFQSGLQQNLNTDIPVYSVQIRGRKLIDQKNTDSGRPFYTFTVVLCLCKEYDSFQIERQTMEKLKDIIMK